MKKLMSTMIIALMGLGFFGMATQPVTVFAAPEDEVEAPVEKGLFDDFDVNIDPETGGVKITGVEDSAGSWSKLIDKYKGFIIGISGIAAVTMVVAFIFQFLKLGTTAGNPSERSKALSGILWTGIAAALLGAVSLITGIFYGFIN